MSMNSSIIPERDRKMIRNTMAHHLFHQDSDNSCFLNLFLFDSLDGTHSKNRFLEFKFIDSVNFGELKI